ncbi:MAG TPA: hypothetical protein VI636_05905 [Candidatus Angelobacter sp.]
MRNQLLLCFLAGIVLLTGCRSRQPVNESHPASVKHVSLGLFEVVDCTAGMVPVGPKGSAEKYCLAAKPVVDETDVRLAQASRNESGGVRLELYFTLKAGDRMREATKRIEEEHSRRNDLGRMAMVIDGVLVSAAEVRGIIGDSLVIDGAFSREEANQIADSLMGRR